MAKASIQNQINALRELPSSVWGVSIAVMLITISAVMAFSVSPIFMTKILGLSLLSLGAVEGFTEFLAQLSRLGSGVVGDYFKKNKPTLMFGFIIATISKPFFIMAGGVSMVVVSKVLERLSNGIMATPRDALVASSVDEKQRGQALGLLMSFKTIGCTIGSLLMGGLLLVTDNYHLLLWIGFGVCFLGIFVLSRYVKEDKSQYTTKSDSKKGFHIKEVKKLNKVYWSILVVACFFMAARFADGFLIKRMEDLGGSDALCASLIGIFNLVSVFCCYPIGRLSDRIPRAKLLIFSMVSLLLCHYIFMRATTVEMGLIATLLWGAQRGTSQVLFVSIVADSVPKHLVGTSLGLFYIISGLVTFISSTIAGKLADLYSLSYTFEFGVWMALASFALLAVRSWWLNKYPAPQAVLQEEVLEEDLQQAA